VADGTPPLTYLWFLNGASFPDTNWFLVVSALQPSQAGAYTVVVTNVSGAVTSAPAILSVIPPVQKATTPTITLECSAGACLHLDCAGTPGPGATWQPLDTVTLASAQQVYADTTDPLPSPRFYRAWQAGASGVKPSLRMTFATKVTLTGSIGEKFRIDYINQFGPTDAWVPLDTVTLANTTQPGFDFTMFHQPARLYG